MLKKHFKLMSGTANKKLAEEVAKILKVPLTPVEIKRFHDGEIYCRVLESVRGADVFIIQPTSPDANLNLMELLIMVDALKRSSPERITAVIPYYGYCRQDKKTKPREPITSKLVANMIQVAGVERVIMFNLHVAQVQGFFDIPSDNLDVIPLFADYIALFGSMLVSFRDLNIGPEYFFLKAIETLRMYDLLTGMAKTIVFAFFISMTACWKGLHTEGGTQGVGNATTWVVVTSSIFIMVSDFFLTKFFILTVYPKY